jgi:hypothetical protein
LGPWSNHLNKKYVVLEKDGIRMAALMDVDEFEDYLELQDPEVNHIIDEVVRKIPCRQEPSGGRAPA